jgi:hypothetical protein
MQSILNHVALPFQDNADNVFDIKVPDNCRRVSTLPLRFHFARSNILLYFFGVKHDTFGVLILFSQESLTLDPEIKLPLTFLVNVSNNRFVVKLGSKKTWGWFKGWLKSFFSPLSIDGVSIPRIRRVNDDVNLLNFETIPPERIPGLSHTRRNRSADNGGNLSPLDISNKLLEASQGDSFRILKLLINSLSDFLKGKHCRQKPPYTFLAFTGRSRPFSTKTILARITSLVNPLSRILSSGDDPVYFIIVRPRNNQSKEGVL